MKSHTHTHTKKKLKGCLSEHFVKATPKVKVITKFIWALKMSLNLALETLNRIGYVRCNQRPKGLGLSGHLIRRLM